MTKTTQHSLHKHQTLLSKDQQLACSITLW